MTSSDRLLTRLREVSQLSFTASSNSASGWNAVGEGVVSIDPSPIDQVIYRETGRWISPDGRGFRFGNVYRWSRIAGDIVRLEHLRMGAVRPVLLFDLTPDGETRWRSVTGHQCKDDCYTAELSLLEDRIRLEWVVEGPERRDVIGYEYI